MPDIYLRNLSGDILAKLDTQAKKRGISIDFSLLRDVLQIPVVSTCARNKEDIFWR